MDELKKTDFKIDLRSKDTMDIEFTINNIKYKVPENIDPQTTLNYFIRNFAKLTGTKSMCLEGGCGACIVSVWLNEQTFSVNSCLVPIFLCSGWNVITIEGIGSKVKGYNSLQSSLAVMNGSQCGFCSPAMIMNMYSLIKSGKNTTNDIENSFGSNICRCTGYRSILDTFQTFANNQTSSTSINVYDIEELHKTVMFSKNCVPCKNLFKDFVTIEAGELEPIYLQLDGAKFFKVFSIYQVFDIFRKYSCYTYILHGGNTGNGVYRHGKKDIYIDINSIHDLHKSEKTVDTLIVGSGVTLEVTKDIFHKVSSTPGFAYLQKLADHIDLVGHASMRHIGTIAGNLMLKREHPEFQSDIFLILETVGAKIEILGSETAKMTMSLIDFLKTDMKNKLISNIILPKLSNDHIFTSYKIMPVAQNAHAIVNAGFLFKLNSDGIVLKRPNIVFGGINPNFHHARKTENFLEGKNLFNKTALSQALSILDAEINPDHVLPDPTPKFRKLLAEGLYYKFLLSLDPNRIDYKLRSGGNILHRDISSGKSTYDVNKKIWPVNEPVTKLEAFNQTAGEAIYINDMLARHNEVFCVMTLADRVGKIKEIDYKEAMKVDGFVAFYSAKDVPGKNISINNAKPIPGNFFDEPLFAETDVLYAGQPYGVLVATTEYKAFDAVKKVKLIYSEFKKPLLTIKDVLNSQDTSRIRQFFSDTATKAPGKDVKYTVTGTIETGFQYHYTMEAQSCICVPDEDEIDISVATQSPDLIQYSVATCLGIPQNKINIKIKRCGGAYGARVTRTTQVVCACAVAAYKLNRPARLIMSIEDMMKSMGKRPAGLLHYDVKVNESGKIQSADMHYFSNEGYVFNDILPFARNALRGGYDYSTWNLDGHNIKTDLPCSTWCRAPGNTDGTAMIETVMDHISKVTKKDPAQVRLINLNPSEKASIQPIIEELLKTSEFQNRKNEIESYNKYNRWKKRGISFVIMRFVLNMMGPHYSLVSIYARDGTVSISHGGIEVGQGINTKVAQVAAYTLGIDIELIRIKPYTNLTAPNVQSTAASITTDCVTSATIIACNQLLERLKPVKEKLKNPTWLSLVYEAYNQGVDLCAIHSYTPSGPDLPKVYTIYGATVAEVEVDMLTGEHVTRRVDLLEDTGVSLNQKLDVGQIQGAFVMGVGRCTSEELLFDPNTGELTNYRTWNYKPPGAKDIPVDFRVSFLHNASNTKGVLGSKATGEPALCMSVAVPLAIRNALDSARSNAGNNDAWYEMDHPTTIERILLTSLTSAQNMLL